VPLGVLRGYASESFAHSMAESIRAVGKGRVYVYQLDDHDPSGMDAWRDFRNKVTGFLPWSDVVDEEDETTSRVVWVDDDDRGRWVYFERLAVLVDQIEEYALPTRPTKRSDTRSRSFAGDSVEVDAIPPSMLRQLVDEAIAQHVDPEALRLTRLAEQSERHLLLRMAGQGATP
jgi:hypothetical protein